MTLNFPQPPSMNGLYLKAALKRGTLSDGGTIPRLEATLEPTLPVPEVLAAYGKVCGAVNSEVVPPCWPHVLAAPLHLALLTHDDFPLRPLGVVHTRNRITVHRALPIGAPLGVRCWVEGHRQHRLGVEFDLETEVGLDAETVWSSTSTILSRTREATGEKRKPKDPPIPGQSAGRERSTVWHLPADQGRRYARVSGDFNPIHLYPWTAKALGFPRQIAHGMWSLARCLSELEEDLPQVPWTVSVSFRKPVLLPSPVLFSTGREEEALVFDLRTRDAQKPHLEGRILTD